MWYTFIMTVIEVSIYLKFLSWQFVIVVLKLFWFKNNIHKICSKNDSVYNFYCLRFHFKCNWYRKTYRVRQIPFFLENALKKTTEHFLKFLFLFENTILSNGFTNIVTYLWRHPTNNSPTVSNRSSEVAKRHQLCDW